MNQYQTSYSALETFKQCPQKYKFQVIDRIKAPKSKEAVFGNKIHKALQFFHSKLPVSPTLDELLNYIKDIWPSIEEKVFQDEQEDMIYFSEAIKILKNYHNHFSKLKEKPIILGTETYFRIAIKNNKTQEKCILAGKIDRIDKIKDKTIEVIDYKTAKTLPSQADMDNNLQLSLYCLAAFVRWPNLIKDPEDIKLTFYYLKHDETLSTKRTKSQLKEVKNNIWEELSKIEKSDFKQIPSALCDWCGYKKICPMWKHKFEKPSVSDKQIQKTIKEFLELKEQDQKKNKRLSELKEIINNYLDQKKIERVFSDKGYITRLSQIRYTYDLKKIKKDLGPLDKWQTKKEYTILRTNYIKKKS